MPRTRRRSTTRPKRRSARIAPRRRTASRRVRRRLLRWGIGAILFLATLGVLWWLLGIGFPILLLAFLIVGSGIWLVRRQLWQPIFRWTRLVLGIVALALALQIGLSFWTVSDSLARFLPGNSLAGWSGRLLAGSVSSLTLAALLVTGLLFLWPKAVWRVLRLVAHALRGTFSAIKQWFDLGDRETPPAAPVVTMSLPAPESASASVEAARAAPAPDRAAGEDGQSDGGSAETDVSADAARARSPSNRWELPSIELLERGIVHELGPQDLQERARILEEALRSYGVDAKVVQINPGPVVTQFGVEPGWDVRYKEVKDRDPSGRIRVDKDGRPIVRKEVVSRTRVKVEKITNLANDLALALAAPTLRIEAPVPGKPIVGIEVPNSTAEVVTLRDVVESIPFQRLRARSKLAIALGKGAAGEAAAADLARMPHLLIAGATGSGKSIFLSALISCIILHNTPDDVRLLLIDPKRVEMTPFNAIPHLLAPVVVEMDQAVAALRWAAREMDRRYRYLAEVGARNIETYHRNIRTKDGPAEGADPMPYIVIVIDELADMMMTSAEEVERTLCRLAQLARAVGIHLVVATQRPSVDVVTGLIKANFPTRISFAVTSQVDSRTILDTVGAEKLLGRGDMLYLPTDAARPKRLQGCYVSDPEIERLVAYWSDPRWSHLRPPQIESALAELTGSDVWTDGEEDPLLERARQLAREHQSLSASMLQRRLRIGYPRAMQLLERLEEEGLVEVNEFGRGRRSRMTPGMR